MTQVIQLPNANDDEIRQYHRKKLGELLRKSTESLRDIPELLDPSNDQKSWLKRRMVGSATSWESSIEHKPWILRWQYFVLGDYE